MRNLAALALVAACAPALAHPLAPALLEMREQVPGTYAVQWRTSVARVGRAEVAPRLPCPAHLVDSASDGEALVVRWRMECGARGLAGSTVEVGGLDAGRINVILRHETDAGGVTQVLLDAARPRHFFAGALSRWSAFREFFGLGARHLVGGLDHVLFVLGLLLLVRGLRPLVITVTGFTLGHSLTLGATALGVLSLDQAVAEIGIALSLLVLALRLTEPRPAQARAWGLALPFGLLHGLGFASALGNAGLPPIEVPLALLAFNLGIEAGQLVLIAVGLALAALARRVRPPDRTPAAVLPAYVIGSMAALWCIERGVALLA